MNPAPLRLLAEKEQMEWNKSISFGLKCFDRLCFVVCLRYSWKMSLRAANMAEFQHILRVLNTNVDGREKVVIALTAIRGIGRRISALICKKADIDTDKRAGELTAEEISKIVAIVASPTQFSIPSWFLNRQKDVKDGKSRHVSANGLDAVWREDFERLKKMRLHRGLRHYWGLKVRGQHTKTTGRHGRTVGVAKKKA